MAGLHASCSVAQLCGVHDILATFSDGLGCVLRSLLVGACCLDLPWFLETVEVKRSQQTALKA